MQKIKALRKPTVLVVFNGSPISINWATDNIPAIVEAWYPGARGGEAIADILFGKVNPSGHLPITFPMSEEQLPRPELDGAQAVAPSFLGKGEPGQTLEVNHDIEGSDVGYRWFTREAETPLYPFGHGLSYTTFNHSGLAIRDAGLGNLSARFIMTNTGERSGADVAQLYLTAVDGETRQRLVGFAKRSLEPGQRTKVSLSIDPRLLAEWENDGWTVAEGTYTFALGEDAINLGETRTIAIKGFRLDPRGKLVQ